MLHLINRDSPLMTDFVKGEITWKNQFYKTYVKNGCKRSDYFQLQEAANVVSQVVFNRK